MSTAATSRTVEPYFVVDGRGVVLEWSDAVAALLGVSRDAAIGRRCWQVVAGRAGTGDRSCRRECPVLFGLQGGRAPWSVEVTASRARGTLDAHVRAGRTSPEMGDRLIRLTHVAVREAGEAAERTALLHLVEPVGDRRRHERTGVLFERLLDPDGPAVPGLSTRETEVLRLVIGGLTSREVAARLHLSHATVRNQTQGILHKLDARSRLEALANLLRAELDRPVKPTSVRDTRSREGPPREG